MPVTHGNIEWIYRILATDAERQLRGVAGPRVTEEVRHVGQYTLAEEQARRITAMAEMYWPGIQWLEESES